VIKNRFARIFLSLLLAASVSPLAAQCLSEIAQKEKERRSRKKGEKVKTYTDKDLKTPDGKKEDNQDPQISPSAAGWDVNCASCVDPETGTTKEESWRERATAQRQVLATAERRLKDLEEETRKNGSTIIGSTDTMEILTLKARLAEIETQIAQAKEDVEKARRAIEDLEDEARKAAVPPGWLREP
jgi:hypothetical protein